MHRALIHSVLCASLVGGIACSGKRESADARPSVRDVAPDKDHLEITGCLSANASGDQFVLTANSNALSSLANRAAAGEAETFHYQLVGGNGLQSMVGKEVRVVGAVSGKGKDVDVKAADSTTTPAKSGSGDATAAVKTTEQIEMQVEKLNVQSVTPTGSACRPTP
jgi:hypothetical protein